MLRTLQEGPGTGTAFELTPEISRARSGAEAGGLGSDREQARLPGTRLPGSPYGMGSAQALGSSSWMSRTLSMDFWA